MKSIEATGKTVKDAIKQGLNQLGCDADDVEIEVLELGSPGLFGMFGKPAKVRLVTKEKDDAFDIEMPVISLDGGSAPKRQRQEKKPKAEKPKAENPAQEAEAPAQETKRQEGRKAKNRTRKEEAPKDEQPVVQAAPAMEEEPFVAASEEELTDEAKKAREFLIGLAKRMGVEASVEVCQTEEALRMKLSGENMSVLIGRRGETLDAMQYLTSLTVNRGREKYLRVSLDTENYRARREEALRKLAMSMANRVRKTGKRKALEPMNPYERRILHSALQSDPDVTTHSEGEEPYRRVVITLK